MLIIVAAVLVVRDLPSSYPETPSFLISNKETGKPAMVVTTE